MKTANEIRREQNSKVLQSAPHREAAYLIPHLLQYVQHRASCKAEAKFSLYCTCDLTELVREIVAWQADEDDSDLEGGITPWERNEDA